MKLPHYAADAFVYKYGLANGLRIDDGEITQWPFAWGEKPNLFALMAVCKEYEDYIKSIEYKNKRASEYPPIGDQLDAIWKFISELKSAGLNIGVEATSMLELVAAVKTKYPNHSF